MVKPKVVLLIFVSGKIVLTGAKVSTDSDASVQAPSRQAHQRLSSPLQVREEIYQAFNLILPVLSEFKKP